MSAAFSYQNTKRIDGIEGGGTTGWWGARVAKVYGHAPPGLFADETFKTDEELLAAPIHPRVYDIAKQTRTDIYQRLYTLDDFFSAMTKVKVMTICFEVFESIKDCPNGDVPMPAIGEKSMGSHSVMLYGYDKEKRLLHFVNSWGAGWGNEGHGTLPFEYFEDGLIHEAWASSTFGFHTPEKKRSSEHTLPNGKKFLIDESIYTPFRHSTASFASFDVYTQNGAEITGYAHVSPRTENSVEIEEFFIRPEQQGKGFGTALLKKIEKRMLENGYTTLFGWIGAQDIVQDREDKVLGFFKANGYTITEDNTRFHDAVYKYEKVLS